MKGWSWSPWRAIGTDVVCFLVNRNVEKAVKVSLTLAEVAQPHLSERVRGMKGEAIKRALALSRP